jgi:hypothetical protein
MCQAVNEGFQLKVINTSSTGKTGIFSYPSHSPQKMIPANTRSLVALGALASAALGAVVNVEVGVDQSGQQGLVFNPTTVTAKAGDDIAFSFKPPASVASPNNIPHTVTRECSLLSRPTICEG